MGQEHRHLLEEGHGPLVRLFPCGLHADDDVAERRPGELGEVTFAHRESKHVGRTVFMSIDFVQFMNAFVVR